MKKTFSQIITLASQTLVLPLAFTCLIAANPVLADKASDREKQQKALTACQAIDPAAYQSGLYFNPDGYRSFYERSMCFQKLAIGFREPTLCAKVRRRYSLLSSSWGYSQKNCDREVISIIEKDLRRIADARVRYDAESVEFSDFEIRKNGNRKDYDFVPRFSGIAKQPFVLKLELIEPSTKNPIATLVERKSLRPSGESLGYSFFLEKEELEAKIPNFEPGKPYTLRASLHKSVSFLMNSGQHLVRKDFLDREFLPEERVHDFIVKEIIF